MLSSARRPQVHLLLELAVEERCADIELPQLEVLVRRHCEDHAQRAVGAHGLVRLPEVQAVHLLVPACHPARLVAAVALALEHDVAGQRLLAAGKLARAAHVLVEDGLELLLGSGKPFRRVWAPERFVQRARGRCGVLGGSSQCGEQRGRAARTVVPAAAACAVRRERRGGRRGREGKVRADVGGGIGRGGKRGGD